MQEEMSAQDLKERLALIEAMIAEGRQRTESWGWTFLLWGGAYFIAIVWAGWGNSFSVWGDGKSHPLAWPVSMICAFFATFLIGSRKGRNQPNTTIGRAVFSIWISVGTSMLILFPALAISGRLDRHSFVALVAAMLAAANSASGIMLRWKAQFGCAVVWWITSAAACFGSTSQLTVVFLAAIFVCQILFGTYVMILESRRHGGSGGVVHV